MNPADGEDFRYWAFISYSHADAKWGDWLHAALETYRIPSRLVRNAKPPGSVPKRVFPVFRDREELASSASLGENIENALRERRVQVQRALGHLVVDLGDEALKRAQRDYTFFASEDLYGLAGARSLKARLFTSCSETLRDVRALW